MNSSFTLTVTQTTLRIALLAIVVVGICLVAPRTVAAATGTWQYDSPSIRNSEVHCWWAYCSSISGQSCTVGAHTECLLSSKSQYCPSGDPKIGPGQFRGNSYNDKCVGSSTPPPPSTCSGGAARSWTVGLHTCTGTVSSGTYNAGNSGGATDGTAPTTGSASFTCQSTGSFASTPNSGATCSTTAPPPPPTTSCNSTVRTWTGRVT